MSLHVDVITPEKLVLSEDVDFLVAPGSNGELGILPHHIPLLAKLGVGEVRLYKGNEIRYLALAGGFLEVQKGSRVIVLAETAELADDINAERAQLAIERAKTALQSQNLQDLDYANAEASLLKAINRIKIFQNRTRRASTSPR